MLIKGANLNHEQCEIVLREFVHRHFAIGHGKRYANDNEWLMDHAFHFTKSGKRLSRSFRYCTPHYMAD